MIVTKTATKFLRATLGALLVIFIFSHTNSLAQDRSTGSVKGKVRVESGSVVDGVTVTALQGERETGRAITNRKGEFIITGLPPGFYSLTFRKPGLRVGTFDNIEVKAGKVRTLRDRLTLPVDEGTIAFVRGSVFSHSGRSVAGARVELARVEANGTATKIDSRITNEVGAFVFRLAPDAARYRLTVRMNDAEPVTEDVEVDGAAIYRVALSLASSAAK